MGFFNRGDFDFCTRVHHHGNGERGVREGDSVTETDNKREREGMRETERERDNEREKKNTF